MKRYSTSCGYHSRLPHKMYGRTAAEGVESGDSFEDDSSSNHDQVPAISSDDCALPSYQDFSNHVNSEEQRTSSPIKFLNEVCDQESSSSSSSSSSDDSRDSVVDPLYHNSDVSAATFSRKFLTIKTDHGISDAAADAMLNLICDILPVPNSCPSSYKLHKMTDVSDKWSLVRADHGSFFMLDIQSQLEKIISENDDIFTFNFPGMSDITNSSMFHRLDSESVKYVYMVICLDGMASAFHSKAYHLWPVVASILSSKSGGR